jgi:hypothetical protein
VIPVQALTVLLWIVVAYCLIWPLLAFVVIAPYLARSEFDRIFDAADGTGTSPVWFSMFYAYSAFSNTGSSYVRLDGAPAHTYRPCVASSMPA